MDISEIKDGESLKAWLEDKPKEWAQALAARAALRVGPIAIGLPSLIGTKDTKINEQNSILLVFRSLFISLFSSKYPEIDMKSVAADVYFFDSQIRKTINFHKWAVDAVFAPDVSRSASDTIESAVILMRFAANDLDIDFLSVLKKYFLALQRDCAWLEFNDNKFPDESIPSYELGKKHKRLAAELSHHSLWVDGFDERGKIKAADMPEYVLYTFNKFSKSELAQTTTFGFIVDWYKGLSTYNGRANPKNVLTKEAELAIAKMSPEDWGDGGGERDCIAVMDRVAELAGWPKSANNSARKGQNKSSDYSGSSSKPDEKLISQYRSLVKVQVTGILGSIEREKAELGNIPNDEEHRKDWERKREFLLKLENDIAEINNIIPNLEDGFSVPADVEVASQLAALSDEFTGWLNANRPEMVDWVTRLGSATTFIGMMGFLGANMTVATSAVLLMTCGEKVRDAIIGDKNNKDN